jgi:transcriptional regulator with XRE-family HTH domain
MEFKDLLRKYRKSAEVTQARLGELCGWGEDSQSRVANYESGAREPTLSDIKKMAFHVGVSPAELAFGGLQITEDEARLLQAWNVGDAEIRNALRSIVEMTHRTRQTSASRQRTTRARRALDVK